MDTTLNLTADLEVTTRAAEREWLERFTRGPQQLTSPRLLQVGDRAPDATLLDQTGRPRHLSDWWMDGPTLLIFWRHFGCGCGIERAQRLRHEHVALNEAGCAAVVIGMGEPVRSAAYGRAHEIPTSILSDPAENVYRDYGLVEWQPAQVLYDAPPEFLAHERGTSEAFAAARRAAGRPPVDNPWRQTGEFLVGSDGTISLPYYYQYCADYPDPRMWEAALMTQ